LPEPLDPGSEIKLNLNFKNTFESSENKPEFGTVLGDQSASTIFVSNFNDKHFLVGLEFLYHIFAMIQEEYIRHLEQFGGAAENKHREVVELSKRLLQRARPQLQARMAGKAPRE